MCQILLTIVNEIWLRLPIGDRLILLNCFPHVCWTYYASKRNRMETSLSEWINLLTRWFHIVVGISWIGQTWLFIRFERSIEKPPDAKLPDNVAGQMWMVHGGGFFVVEKLTGLNKLPFKLHWFKWESMLTWLSGILLLGFVYYMGGLMVDYESGHSKALSISIGLVLLVVAWPVYELLWRSPLGRNEIAGSLCSYALVLAVAYELKEVMPARAAFFHIGAMLGTIMVANVWFLIIPAQKQIVTMIRDGKPADMSLASRARQSSKQNSFMAVPVIFLMISNHYPVQSYAHKHSVAMLALYLVLGWFGTRVIREGIGGLIPGRKRA